MEKSKKYTRVTISINASKVSVPIDLQSTSAALYLHYFHGILLGFVISMFLTHLNLRVDLAVNIPSFFARNITVTFDKSQLKSAQFHPSPRYCGLSQLRTPDDCPRCPL